MPRVASLQPYKTDRSTRKWCVDVPPHLSPTSKRQRLFFKTEQAAKAECGRLQARKDNFGISLRSLSPARVAEAAEAYKLLSEHGVGLVDAVNGFLAIHKQRVSSVTFDELFDLFLTAKADRSPRYLSELKITKSRAEFEFIRAKLVCDIEPSELEALLSDVPPAARNAIMRYLRAVFRLGIRKGYLQTDPISRLEFSRRPRKEVETIPHRQVSKMLQEALKNEPELLPFLVFGFFCGIRPDGELLKLEWSDVNLTDRVVTIRPEISKTNRRRFVNFSTNAAAWLRAYRIKVPKLEGLVVKLAPSPLREMRKANRDASGVTSWPSSAMRHTFCSNWLAHHGDINKLVLMSGHDSVDTMWRHYHRGTTKAEARAFWKIRPPRSAGNIVPFEHSHESAA
jgi:integrase